jgi:hypothetical protein
VSGERPLGERRSQGSTSVAALAPQPGLDQLTSTIGTTRMVSTA